MSRSGDSRASSGTRALVARAQEGDRAAADQLFERLLPRVRRIVALRMGCRQTELWDCEDLLQETLCQALLDLGSFEDRGDGTLCNWISKMVHNKLASHNRALRAAKRDARRTVRGEPEQSGVLTEAVFGHDSDTPSRIAAARELEERIERALLELPERQRQAFELRRICEMSHEEIAAEMGLGSASSASALFSRALSALGRKLKP